MVINVLKSILILSSLIRNAYAAMGLDDSSPIDERGANLHSELYETIGRIAAEQAAKPEIQGFSEHD